MEYEQKHRRRPLLYSIAQSGSWETQNILDSFMASEAIQYFGSAVAKEEGPMPIDSRTTELETGDLGFIAQVTPGDTLTPLPQRGADPNLREIADRTRAANEKSTVAGVLQGAGALAGEAFASINLRTQTALGALKAALELSEYALADIYTLFLLYAHYTEKDLVGFGTGKEDNGQAYTIKADQIYPDGIYLSVKLKPDVPLDRMQKANTAMMLVNAGIYSKERAMEDMGITDPDMVTEEIFFERMTEARWQNMIETMNLQMQTEAQMQIQAQQQALAGQQTEMAGAPQGQGFNPAQGGGPPQEAAPGATREGVTGEDMMGNEALMGGFE